MIFCKGYSMPTRALKHGINHFRHSIWTRTSRYGIALLFLCVNSYALTLPIPQQLHNRMSVMVLNNQTGKAVFSHSENTPRLVASNMKLITAAVALRELHGDFRWHTKLFYSGTVDGSTLNGNLYLLGGGDPTMDDRALNEIFSQLQKIGIHKIKGDLVLDTSIFNSLTTYSMLKEENYDVDTVLPAGIIVDGNISRFTIHVNNRKVSLDNNLYGYEIKNNLRVNANQSICGDLTNQLQMQDKTITFNGTISPQCNGLVLELNLVNNPDYTRMALKRSLDSLSIKLNGNIRYANAPDKANLVYDYSSQSLQDALVYMNHYSVNLIAETILLSLGAYIGSNDDTYADGKKIYTKYMEQEHLLNPKFILQNGAGLSRTEYISAAAMGRLLLHEAHSADKQNFEATLPRSGLDGSLKYSFTSFGNRVMFKTGTLNDTRAYSGYFYNRHGTQYTVVAVANDINTNDPTAMKIFNGWVNKLLAQLDK